MPRNGPIFVSSKQVNTYMSTKSAYRPSKLAQPVHNSKAPVQRRPVAPPPESPAQCLQRLLKEFPADKQLTVAFRLFAVILINKAVLEAELQQEQQWAWLAEYEASRGKHCQELCWDDMSAQYNELAPSNQQADEVVSLAGSEQALDELECIKGSPNTTKQQQVEDSSAVKQAQEPITITVFAYHPEELPSAAVEAVSMASIGHVVEDDSSNMMEEGNSSTQLGFYNNSSSSSTCMAIIPSIVYSVMVASITSVLVMMQLIRVAAYCSLAFTCYTVAAADVAVCTVVGAEVTAVAVASCKRLSNSLSSSFKRLASPRSSCDVTW